eukprot:gb/GEZJ01007910.1/.p1 GENE.gb/GEZJ01007910.1/~~gb/GEZJ01007910.1/.p1  ORF type:complete len:111 (-),score=9.05 gb/GEZJ01007910.1/:140-472(-)
MDTMETEVRREYTNTAAITPQHELKFTPTEFATIDATMEKPRTARHTEIVSPNKSHTQRFKDQPHAVRRKLQFVSCEECNTLTLNGRASTILYLSDTQIISYCDHCREMI